MKKRGGIDRRAVTRRRAATPLARRTSTRLNGMPSENGANGARASHAATKLARLNERFASFYSDLEQEKTHRRALESDRARALEERLDVLEREVRQATERGRAERAREYTKLESALGDIDAKLSARAQSVEERLSTSVSALTAAVESVHEALTAERTERASEVELMGGTLGKRMEEHASALDDERLSRLEREAELINRLGNEMTEIRAKVDAERNTRESAVGKLATVIEEVRHQSAAEEGDFHAVVLEELSALKAGLQKERAERAEEDELIVQAVGEYSKTIQNGLRIANQ